MVNTSHGIPATHLRASGPKPWNYSMQLSATVDITRPQEMAQLPESLLSTWDIQLEFQLCTAPATVNMNQRMEDLFVSTNFPPFR